MSNIFEPVKLWSTHTFLAKMFGNKHISQSMQLHYDSGIDREFNVIIELSI